MKTRLMHFTKEPSGSENPARLRDRLIVAPSAFPFFRTEGSYRSMSPKLIAWSVLLCSSAAVNLLVVQLSDDAYQPTASWLRMPFQPDIA